MAKDTKVTIRISEEKKKLWEDDCDAHGKGLTLTGLIELAVDDRVTNVTEFRDKAAGTGLYWILKPNGEYRKQYDSRVERLGRMEIERLNKHKQNILNGIYD